MENALQTTTDQTPQTIEREFDIDGFLEKRKEFIEKVNKIMVEGKDYHVIQSKKSMAKGGAEKIASIFSWTATFEKDNDVAEAFSNLQGLVAFVCNLHKNGELIGQGRGAALLSKNANDPNKTIKMAQKSAFIDAVIRASGLSDFYTQDLEDMNPNDIQSQNSSPRSNQGTIPPSQAQYDKIAELMEQKGITKEDLIDQGFIPGTLTGGRGGTASQMIDYLIKARSKKDVNGNDYPEPVDEELPIINVETAAEREPMSMDQIKRIASGFGKSEDKPV